MRTIGPTCRRLLESAVLRVRRRGRQALARAARLTGAAVASYVVALWLSPNTQPLLAPLTALLVVQVTLFSMLTNGVQRMISVVAGVLRAVLFSSVVGLTWWSLGLLIGASVVIGQLLRLGPHMVEVPISAMLVLGVGSIESAESAAAGRIAETLVGAVVGVLVNLLFPPAIQARHAGAAVDRFAGEMAGVLDTAAAELLEGASVDQATRWVEDARRLSRHVPRLDRALVYVEESRRLNLRALGTPDTRASMRGGLDALEHCSVAVRTLCRSMLDGLRGQPEVEDETAAEVRRVFSELLHCLAAALRSFGRVVSAEAEGTADQEEAELTRALEDLREARARIADLLFVDPRDNPALWELNGVLLATVERVLRELDVQEHARLRQRRREGGDRFAAVPAVQALRETTRRFAQRPRAEPPPGGK